MTDNGPYGDLLEAAVRRVGSDAGSIQLVDADGVGLRLVAWRGFHPASAAFWELVVRESSSTCGIALAAGERIVVADLEVEAALAGSDDLEEYRRSGLRSVQSTPLLSEDDGRVVGMVSTHWRERHEPTEEELRLIDALASAANTQRTVQACRRQVAARQYRTRELNRHIAARVEQLDSAFRDLTGARSVLTLLCACGREGCHETITVPFAVYDQTHASLHRCFVANGHAASVDTVILESDGYDVVQLGPEYRVPQRPAADVGGC